MLQRIIGIALVLIGAAMIIVGVNASRILSPHSYWSDQQAKEYIAASTALKNAATGTIRQPSAEKDPQLTAARQRFDTIQAELDSAIAHRDYSGIALGASGTALLAFGIGVFLRAKPIKRESADDDRPFIRRKE